MYGVSFTKIEGGERKGCDSTLYTSGLHFPHTHSLLVSTPTINNHHLGSVALVHQRTPLIGARVMAATAYDESGAELVVAFMSLLL